MKNVLTINMLNSCSCDCLSNIASEANEILLNVMSDISLNPKLVINGNAVDITEDNFLYKIPSLSASITFHFQDDTHTGEVFTITLPATIEGDLIVNEIDNFNYVGKCRQKISNGIPIATTEKLGGVKVGATLNVQSDGTLNANEGEAMTAISNIWLEEHLI